MVQIHALLILKAKDLPPSAKNPIIVASHIATSSWYTFLWKDQVTEFTQFFGKFLASRTKPGFRQQVSQDQYVGYVHARQSGLTTVLVTDKEYPSRVAFNALQQVVMDFDDKFKANPTEFKRVMKDGALQAKYGPELKAVVDKYQDPVKADKILKVKKDLEETKTVLNRAIEQLLDRGEKLDDMILKTDMLSDSSKEFYIKARKNNSCCTIL